MAATTMTAVHASGLVVVCHLHCSDAQRNDFAAVPSAEGLLIWRPHLLHHAEDDAAPPHREEETVRHGESKKARTDDGSAIKASQLNNADHLFGFSQ
jgi:hypothetical protein